jgi:hypothetical protein
MHMAMVLSLGTAFAADAPTKQPRVDVTATRDPAEKSYRRIVRGMDLFERNHGLAPKAPLRFKLLPRNRETSMEDIALRIVGDAVTIPVTVAADNTFALQRSQQALDEDAAVVPNRRARSMTWRTEIRTPGLPPNTRRLGDLRLECLVGIEADLVSNAASIVQQLARFITDPGYCDQPEPEYLFFAERPLWSVTLVDGSRRKILALDQLYGGSSRKPMTRADLEYCDCEVLLDRTYYAPLGDRSWPDDTLLEFEYMDEDILPASGTKADIAAALGEATTIRFESGYEVWLYRLGSRDGHAEFVILFTPTGVVAKSRLRTAAAPP